MHNNATEGVSFDAEGCTVESGPVSVRKVAKRIDDGVVVRYELHSSADEPVSVWVHDSLPPGGCEKVGFNTDHEPVEWAEEDGGISFAHTVEPARERVVVLGIVLGEDVADEFDPTRKPEVTRVERIGRERGGTDRGARAMEDGEETSIGASDGGVEDGKLVLNDPVPEQAAGTDGTATQGERPSTIEREGGSTNEPVDAQSDGGERLSTFRGADTEVLEHHTNEDGESDSLEVVERPTAQGEEPNGGEAGESEGGTGPPPNASSVEEGSVISMLVTELREGTVSDEEVESLREELRVERPRSETIRLEHVQARMDDFAAYVDLLEGFVDEYGPLAEHAERTWEVTDALRDRLDDVDERIDELGDGHSSIRSRLDTLESAVDELSTDVDGIEAAIEEHDAKFDEAADRHATIEEEIEAVERANATEVTEVRTVVEEMETILNAVGDAFDLAGEDGGGDG